MTSLESSGLNAGYVEQLLEQYLDNPEAVDPAWRAVFAGEEPAAAGGCARLRRQPRSPWSWMRRLPSLQRL